MRKMLLAMLLAVNVQSDAFAQKQAEQLIHVHFVVHIINPGAGGTQFPKNKVQPPVVCYDGSRLYFLDNHPPYDIVLKDENDIVVLSATILEDEEEYVFPSSLSGCYTITLYSGIWCFSGDIEL